MAYHLTTQFGATERDPSPERMAAVIDGIDPSDEEHPDVSLTHESEWCIGVFTSGLVTFENLEDRSSRPTTYVAQRNARFNAAASRTPAFWICSSTTG